MDIQLYTALLHTESNKTKDLIRTSKEYSQILITSQQESFPIHRYNQTRLLFRSTHFLSPIQDTIHFEVPTGKISTTIRADPAPFSEFKAGCFRDRGRGSQGSEGTEQENIEQLHCIVFNRFLPAYGNFKQGTRYCWHRAKRYVWRIERV